ncbi:DUF4262 domain-containing protein [Actinoalloteichus spitiensis]|uniref:DUF4262 domain-containing protein n=1 Tax=Actinoalloteichus spitiensis TaxID=252394 RepID=UPI00036FE827|nr:DUF4262 domain-containing protein [Actinoalloteichus spitiensis]
MADDQELRRKLRTAAEEDGVAIVHVAAERGAPPFAQTVGVYRSCGMPEVVVIGLPPKVAHAVLGTYSERARAGENFVPGRCYERFLKDLPVTFERVHRGFYAEYFGHAFLLNRKGNFPALQMIVAAPDGSWPWQPDAPGGFAQYQPVLTDSGRPESWVPGETGP